jgi:uncharacterized protein (DUF3084 family)
MNDAISTSLIAIIPAVFSSIVTYAIAAKRSKLDLVNLINESNEKLRKELKKDLDECRTDRDAIRSDLNTYKKENESIKKELREYKDENKRLQAELNELEIKLDASNEIIKTLLNGAKVNKKKVEKLKLV